jgi:hypothetical protein
VNKSDKADIKRVSFLEYILLIYPFWTGQTNQYSGGRGNEKEGGSGGAGR